jgi:hypothetical protein
LYGLISDYADPLPSGRSRVYDEGSLIAAEAYQGYFVNEQYAGREYDVVIGAVANDDVLPTILLYINGQLDENLTIGALKTRRLVDQYCFKTDKALALLKFQNAEVFSV